MSSYEEYVGKMKSHSPGDIMWGAILGKEHGSMWGQGKEKTLATDEAVSISKCFKLKDFSSMEQQGVTINGEQFKFVKSYKGSGAKRSKLEVVVVQGDGGTVIIYETKHALLIGWCSPRGDAEVATEAVESLAKFMTSNGYDDH